MAVQRLNGLRYQNTLIIEVCSFMNCLTSCKRDGVVQAENWVDGHTNLSHCRTPGPVESLGCLLVLSLHSGYHQLWDWVENIQFLTDLFKIIWLPTAGSCCCCRWRSDSAPLKGSPHHCNFHSDRLTDSLCSRSSFVLIIKLLLYPIQLIDMLILLSSRPNTYQQPQEINTF